MGHYALTMAAFWFAWANVMTTATSLRFEKPKINLDWIVTFPFGILVGSSYLVWAIAHIDAIH